MAIIKTARRTLIASGTVAAVVALGAFPFKLITVPEWRIQFTDLRGSALTGLEVEQNWQNYTVEIEAHVAKAKTDASGHVTFPERSLTTSPLMFFVGAVRSLGRGGIHASFGPSSSIIAQCGLIDTGERLTSYYGTDLPIQAKLRYSPSSAPPQGCEPLIEQAIKAETSIEVAARP